MRYFCILALALPLGAQSVEIHSEFQRVNPYGEVVPIDRSDYPREILSPEVPRNAHTVFHVAVTAPPNTSYFLYVGSNPGNLIETTLYKEDFERAGDQWIPDALTPSRIPAFGVIPDASAAIPGQTTRCYLLDIWVPPQVDPQRVRVEVLLKIGVWYVAPMEVRIGRARVPTGVEIAAGSPSLREPGSMPGVADRIDRPAMECLARYLLGRPPMPAGDPMTIRDVIRRDAAQDMAIAGQIAGGARAVPQPLWFLADNGIVENWMENPALMNWSGAEWYLRVRDWIYRNASQ